MGLILVINVDDLWHVNYQHIDHWVDPNELRSRRCPRGSDFAFNSTICILQPTTLSTGMQFFLKSVLIVAAMGSGAVHAQSIVTDRPDQTESSSTVPGGSLQIEAGFLLGYTEDESESNRQILGNVCIKNKGRKRTEQYPPTLSLFR